MTVDAAKHDDELVLGVCEETEVPKSRSRKSDKMDKEEVKEKEPDLYDLPGVGAATAEKLKECGYDSVMSIAVASPGKLIEDAGVSEPVARKMINAARNSLKMGFMSGVEVLAKREKVQKISTGSKAFDELLGGGFETGSIVECFGEFGSGKTQVGHILAVHCQLDQPDAIAVYIDTENTFRPERIKQLAEGAGLDPDAVLKNIKVAKAYNSDHQMLLADKVSEMITAEKLNVRVVIVDSLTAHFRAEFIGRGTLAERQQKINRHMHTLLKIADMHNACVYVTNQVQADPAQFFGDPTKAVGGHIVAHASTFRIYLRKGKKGSRVAKLIDAPNLPDGECNFMVETGGLKDL
ncbi:DNA repair and recombination protein RadA [Candidatus Woesearchaeota archaeon]|nr:DNA repair and recombination protein RadA [Candidatus Woesearchaeota archaeon]